MLIRLSGGYYTEIERAEGTHTISYCAQINCPQGTQSDLLLTPTSSRLTSEASCELTRSDLDSKFKK